MGVFERIKDVEGTEAVDAEIERFVDVFEYSRVGRYLGSSRYQGM